MYPAYQAQADLMWPLRTMAKLSAPMFQDPSFAFADLPATRRMLAACKLLQLAEVTHRRPAWQIDHVMVKGEAVPITEEVVASTPFATLLRFRKEGVPVEQWRILKVLSDGKGHSMGELAEAVLLNHPTLTKMIDRMVTDALVYRVQDADDRRKVVMFSSDRGKTLTQRLNSLALSQEAHISENYGNKATAELKRLLETLIEKAN